MGSEQIFKLDNSFIMENIDDLIHLVDYVPFSFADYNAQEERDEFLKSKNLLTTMQNMDQVVHQKCNSYENTIKAYNSVLIEWLNLHPEFEAMISSESFDDYLIMKENESFIEFIDLLDFIEVPLDKTLKKKNQRVAPPGMRVSSIPFPDFKKIKEAYDQYPNSLLADYLGYLV